MTNIRYESDHCLALSVAHYLQLTDSSTDVVEASNCLMLLRYRCWCWYCRKSWQQPDDNNILTVQWQIGNVWSQLGVNLLQPVKAQAVAVAKAPHPFLAFAMSFFWVLFFVCVVRMSPKIPLLALLSLSMQCRKCLCHARKEQNASERRMEMETQVKKVSVKATNASTSTLTWST